VNFKSKRTAAASRGFLATAQLSCYDFCCFRCVVDPSAAENSRRRRKFYSRRKSAAKYCGWSASAVNLLFGGRGIFFAKFGGGSVNFCSTLQFLNFCKAIVTKPDTRDYVMDTFHQEQFGHWAQCIKGFLLPI